jgi:hypothetical protein
MPTGSYGCDTQGVQVDETSSATKLWALILGALQGILGLGGGGGGGGTVSINQTGTANGVQIVGAAANGNTTTATTVRTTEGPITIAAGAISIEFLLSTDFTGTINGAAFDNTVATLVVGVYRVDAPPWKPLAAFIYTITAGTAIRTIQT